MSKTKYQATESFGDTLVGDIVLTADQRKLAGKVQNLELAYEQAQERFADALQQIKRAEEAREKAKAELYKSMEEAGVKTIESDILKITLVQPTKSEGLDIKGLQARDPRMWQKLFAEYGKTTHRRGYVKITDKRNRKQTLELGDVSSR